MNYQELWNKTSFELSKNYAEDTFQEIFSEVKTVIKEENGTIFVRVPNLYIRKKINDRYIFRLHEILQTLTPEIYRFKFVTGEEMVSTTLQPLINETQKSTIKTFETNLNPNWNFESFVVGDSNMMSFRMAMNVAEQPGEVANPLYIFGGVGLGKTHLMHSIGNYMLDKNLNKKILYIAATSFIHDYSKAATSGDMSRFEEKYDDLDALLIDDIQMLEMGKKSQQHFFQLFNKMYDNKKQIIITSDCPANQLKGIMDRLTSRFSWGLMVDIKLPNLAHRVNILKRKILETQESEVPESVLEYIASHYTNNIRELEGALNRVIFHCITLSVDVTVENAKDALAAFLKNKKHNGDNDNFENVQSVIADYYNITIADLLSNKRQYKYVLPRHITMYILKQKYSLSLKRIGALLGGRDHTTVLAACAKIEQEIKTDNELKIAIDSILKKIE